MSEQHGVPDRPAGLPAGVESLDHTADIGMSIEAESLTALFDRAARGAIAFLTGSEGGDASGDGSGAAVVESITLEADDAAVLLVAWLREILYLAESRGLCYVGVSFRELSQTGLRARLSLEPCVAPVAREIKGVTYHGLEVTPTASGWAARVIFDV